MRRAATLLSFDPVVGYLFWTTTCWNNDPATFLPIYVFAIIVQCRHLKEEYKAGFQRQFPRLMGDEWSDAQFLRFNAAWLAIFVPALQPQVHH